MRPSSVFLLIVLVLIGALWARELWRAGAVLRPPPSLADRPPQRKKRRRHSREDRRGCRHCRRMPSPPPPTGYRPKGGVHSTR